MANNILATNNLCPKSLISPPISSNKKINKTHPYQTNINEAKTKS